MKAVPKQKRSERTKAKIKATASTLFSKHGYYTVTTNMIAKEAGIPIGSFYNYYRNKKEVILELIVDTNTSFHDETIEKYLEMEIEINAKRDVLHLIQYLLIETLKSNYLSNPLYKITHSLQFTEEDVQELEAQIRLKEIGYIKSFLEKINRFHPLKSITTKARLIHSSIENVILHIQLLDSDVNSEELLSETAKMVYHYLFAE